ncbi:enoyl-CoA hydratase-related protein [Terrarubrum flagellatum]|uniref:enoyl-CoA hydratase-related protein n=1 Tax=Terrirubrum flagellatum TaxID=2895980 RepID=UPI003145234F
MADESDSLQIEKANGLLILRINRPHVSNAVDAATSYAIDAALSEAETDDSIGAVIVTGAGERAFCSGMDLKEAARIGVGKGLVPGRGFCGLTERNFPKPLIAAINGAAVAGGLELALACDLIVASETATFGLPEIKRGLVAYAGGVQRLARLAPRSAAMEIILTGEPLPARRLYELGVVSRVVPAARVMEEARALARSILANSRVAARYAKELYALSLDRPLDEALKAGHEIGARMPQADAAEGVAAYAEKRAAHFGGA